MCPSIHTAPRRVVRCGLFALITWLLASAVVADRPALAQAIQGGDGRSELVLTNLPPKGSKAYKDLLGLAGKRSERPGAGLHAIRNVVDAERHALKT